MSRLKPKALRDACRTSNIVRQHCLDYKDSITRAALELAGLKLGQNTNTTRVYSFLAKYGFWKHLNKNNKNEVLYHVYYNGAKHVDQDLVEFYEAQGLRFNSLLAQEIAVAAASKDKLDIFIHMINADPEITDKHKLAFAFAGFSKDCLKYLFSRGLDWEDMDADVVQILTNKVGVWLFEKPWNKSKERQIEDYTKRDITFIKFIVKNRHKTDPDFQDDMEFEIDDLQNLGLSL
jgi:hypothetical protein